MRSLEYKEQAYLSQHFQERQLEAVLHAFFSMPYNAVREEMCQMVRNYIKGPGSPSLLDIAAKSEGDFPLAGFNRKRFQRVWFEKIDAIIAERKAAPGREQH